MPDKSGIIMEAFAAIKDGETGKAKEIISNRYAFNPVTRNNGDYNEYKKIKIFMRDGFIDRYSGQKLVFPPVLRIISTLMPDEFPYHGNWKMSECHIAYWELYPTIDHIIPLARGGSDKESNWVCTSQMRNSAKANWLLEEIEWKLFTPGLLENWDGLLNWFMEYIKDQNDIIEDKYILTWYKAAKKALSE